MASSSSGSAAATPPQRRHQPRPPADAKPDWHAVATREFAHKNWRQAAAAWTRALALVPITERPHLELERMLYLGNRSLAYFQCGWLALARDDIESVLRMQYVYDGTSLSVEPAGRTVVFAAQIAEYHRLVRTAAITPAASAVASTTSDTPSAAAPTTTTAATAGPTIALPSWIESLGYFRTSGAESPTLVYDRLMQRTLRDVERLGRVLEAFGATKAAAAVYTLLGGVDRRSGDARAEWAKRAATALAPKSRDYRAPQSLVEPLWDAWSDWQQSASSSSSSATTETSLSQASENESKGATEPESAAPSTDVKEEEDSEDRVLWTASIGLPVSVPIRSGDPSSSVPPAKRRHRAPEPDLECRRTSKYGRGLYARVDMLPGDAVWTERPLVSVAGVETVCGHCHRQVEGARRGANDSSTSNTASVCRAVHCFAIYCSATCRSADASVHAEICAPEFDLGAWRRRMSRGTNLFTAVLALKLLAHTLADRRRRLLSDAKSSATDVQSPTHPPVYGSDDVHVREWMRGIGDTAAKISASSSDGAPDTTVLSMSAGALYQLYDLGRVVLGRVVLGSATAPSSAATPSGVVVACFPAALHPQVYNLANYYAAMRLASACSACFLVGGDGADGEQKSAGAAQFGYGLYPIASVFNHSCTPNVAYHFAGERVDERGRGEARDFMVCVATRAVKKGEQLFVSYCDEDDTYENRTRWLRANRDLTCNCAKCCGKL